MNAGYSDSAFTITDLDKEDKQNVDTQYSKDSSARRSGADSIYMIANGYLWRYLQSDNKLGNKISDGYPKRLGEVFEKANTKIAAAFDTGYFVFLIREDGDVLKYKYSSGFAFVEQKSVSEMFGIDQPSGAIWSAFNHEKLTSCKNSVICTKTTIIVDKTTRWELEWTNKGKAQSGSAVKKTDMTSLFGTDIVKGGSLTAATEVILSSGLKVLEFDNGLDDDGQIVKMLEPFPADLTANTDGQFQAVAKLFKVDGWCLDGSTGTTETSD
eukprot:sb/3468203/